MLRHSYRCLWRSMGASPAFRPWMQALVLRSFDVSSSPSRFARRHSAPNGPLRLTGAGSPAIVCPGDRSDKKRHLTARHHLTKVKKPAAPVRYPLPESNRRLVVVRPHGPNRQTSRPRGLPFLGVVLCAALVLMQSGICCQGRASGTLVEICSGVGVVVVRMDAAGNVDVPVGPAQGGCADCAFCISLGAFDLPVSQGADRPETVAAVPVDFGLTQHVVSQRGLWPETRGPPGGSKAIETTKTAILTPAFPAKRVSWI
ncbi:hypothetical protein [Tropicimonas sp.]|uniref:hypothetical protein n=1 Tax=Tropicimonas sp. TaxID=2067044 RepID=UPI003A85FE16